MDAKYPKRRKVDRQLSMSVSAPLSAAAALRARRQQQQHDSESSESPSNTELSAASISKSSARVRRKKSKDTIQPAENDQSVSGSGPATAKMASSNSSATNATTPLSAAEDRKLGLEETAKTLTLQNADDSDDSVDSYGPDYIPRPSDGAESSLYASPKVEVSSWVPTTKNVPKHNSTGMAARLAPSETLATVGIYDVVVKRGVVTLYGAILRAGPQAIPYRVFAPATHALPVIECLSPDGAEVELKSVNSELPSLEKLSPLYGRLWKAEQSADQSFLKNHKRHWSFENIHVLSDDSLSRPLYHLEMPPEWHKAIDKICSAASKRNPGVYEKVMVCGPKSTGKSTFGRFLLNRLFTIDREAMKSEHHSVFLLDIDPGQPEYGPPGQISLIELRRPIFGPPFVHPSATVGTHQRTVRAHYFGANSPKDDPEHFVKCAFDLTEAYHKHISFGNTRGPLVINTPGWIIGTGLQILLSLLIRLSPTDLVYTSDEPNRALDALTAATTTGSTVQRFQYISSQPSGHPVRSAAEFRTLQSLSYFHLAAPRQKDLDQVWDPTPLSHRPPFVVSYAASAPNFLAVLDIGEPVAPAHISTVLDGNIVGVVELSASSPMQIDNDNDNGVNCDYSTRVARTPAPYSIPYITPSGSTRRTVEPPSPHTSRLVTLALVRGIDAVNQALHLLVPPANEHLVRELDTQRTVLVLGTMEAPGWAYLEDIHMEEWRKREGEKSGATDTTNVAADIDVGRVPWVKREGAGAEASVGVIGARRRLRRFVG